MPNTLPVAQYRARLLQRWRGFQAQRQVRKRTQEEWAKTVQRQAEVAELQRLATKHGVTLPALPWPPAPQ